MGGEAELWGALAGESGKIVDLLNGREGRGTCEPEGKKWMGAFECCQCGE